MQEWKTERFRWMRGTVITATLAVIFAAAAPAGAEKIVTTAPSGGPASFAAGCLGAKGELIEILDGNGNIVESSCEIGGDTSVCNWVQQKCVYNVAPPDDGVGGPIDDGVLDGGDSDTVRPPILNPSVVENGNGTLSGRSTRQDDDPEKPGQKAKKHDKTKKHGKHKRSRR